MFWNDFRFFFSDIGPLQDHTRTALRRITDVHVLNQLSVYRRNKNDRFITDLRPKRHAGHGRIDVQYAERLKPI